MRILITGSKGQLGQEFVKLFSKEQVLATDKDAKVANERLDITDEKKIKQVFKKFQPEIVLHCAAYTQVDKAEIERDLAFLINEKGTENVARAAYQIGAKFVYISTDYVFDGAKNSPYTEEDVPCPINVYGQSKLKGEEAIKKIYTPLSSRACVWLIIRTSWLYGSGHNFVRTILKLAKEKDQIEVVSDQIGSPTWARDLAKAIKSLLKNKQNGIFHASGRGETSWFEFAKEIVKFSRRFSDALVGAPTPWRRGGRDPDTQRSSGKTKIVPIKTEDFKRPAKRPYYSYLSCKKLDPIFQMPRWQESLAKYLSSNF